MKIHKFLDKLYKIGLYNCQIDNFTLRTIILEFQKCLSSREKDSSNILIDMILSNTSKQLKIDSIVDDIKYKELEKQFNELKHLHPK